MILSYGIRISEFGIRTYQWNRFKITLFRIDGNIGRLNYMRFNFSKLKLKAIQIVLFRLLCA